MRIYLKSFNNNVNKVQTNKQTNKQNKSFKSKGIEKEKRGPNLDDNRLASVSYLPKCRQGRLV